MKSMNRNFLFTAVLCALALVFGTTAYAEKGAETLLRLTKGSALAKTETVSAATHKCLNCTDSSVSVVDKARKGPNHLVTQVVRHNCKGCVAKIAIEETGKAKCDVAIHSCNAETKPLCCAQN